MTLAANDYATAALIRLTPLPAHPMPPSA